MLTCIFAIKTHINPSVCRVVVVLENRVYVYNFADLRLIDAIDTCNNPKGLCALNPDGKDQAILVTPASQKGYVRIAYYSP